MDMSNVPNFVKHNIGWTDRGERDPIQFIPYFDHCKDNIIVLKDGGLMAMIHCESSQFNMASQMARNTHSRRHFALYQLIGDPQTEITEHLVCHKNVEPFKPNDGGSDYYHEFMGRYDDRVLRHARQFDWFISIIVYPRPFSGAWFRRIKKGTKEFFDLGNGIPDIDPELIRRLEGKVRTVRAALQRQNPSRIGAYARPEAPGVKCSAMARALHLIRTGRLADFPMQQPAGSFPYLLYRDRVVHGSMGFVVHRAGGTGRATVGRAYGFNSYPRYSRVGMFDMLMSDKEEIKDTQWTMTNHARPLSRAKASDSLKLTLERLQNTKKYSHTDQKDLEEALDDLESAREIRADHAWSFVVHAEDMPTLDIHATELIDIISGTSGCVPAPAGLASECLYWSMLPGNRKLSPQPARIGLRRFAHLSSLEGYPIGAASETRKGRVRWGAPIMRFLTAGGSIYDHEMFSDQIAHGVFIGPSGSGKSVFAGALATAATSIINNKKTGKKGTILVFDKDMSQRLMVLNNCGQYTILKRGENSNAAPMQRLKNNKKGKLILSDLINGMILADGDARVPSETVREQIRHGIEFEMSKPPKARSIAGIHAWIPPAKHDPSDSANRLKPWCRGERLGWAFDGEIDTLDFNNQMVGVDYTELLEDEGVMPIMAAYLFHLAGEVMDSRRMIFLVEELKFLLPKPEFTRSFEDVLLTGRKKNVAFWPLIQQPESIMTHPIGPAILGQCRTRYLFKNEFASRDAYVGRPGGPYGDGLHCTEAEYYQVSAGMTVGTHSVIIQRAKDSVLCRFSLDKLPEDIAILSGTPKTNEFWDAIDPLSKKRNEFVRRIDEVEV